MNMIVRAIASSGPVSDERLDAGLALLTQEHFHITAPNDIRARQDYLAGSDTHRLQDFIAALAEQPDVLWAARGGYGAARIAPYVLDQLPLRLPLLVGFSDVTVLHAVWHQRRGRSIHAANISTLMDWGDDARNQLLDIVRGTRTEGVLPCIATEGRAEGPLFAANLTVLASLVGTPLMPDLTGCILIVEDINEAPYRLDRVMTQLTQSGALDGIVGLGMGQCTGDHPYDNCVAAIARGLNRPDLPICWGLQIGHEATSWAVPQGAMAKINSNEIVWTLP